MFNKKSVVATPEYLNCGVCKNDVAYGLVFPDDEHGTMCWYCICL
jgi:hypothetical protein